MSRPRISHHLLLLLWVSFFFVFSALFHPSHGDIGTAARYSPPYSPTKCYASDLTQFPSNNFFAAAGEGIWDNGASCGRQYLVKCISANAPRTCILNQTIQIIIVDYALQIPSMASASGKTLVLSANAYAAIANSTANSINIEFQQV